MAKTIKSLLGVSMVIRNLGTLSNYTMTRRFIQISTNCVNIYSKESLVSPRPHLVNDNAHELQNSGSMQEMLKQCNVTTQVLSIIRANQSKMTTRDTILALETLFDIERNKSLKHSKIYDEPEFLVLCEILRKNMRRVIGGDLLTILKVFIYFEVPATSIIFQMVLQILRQTINHVSLQELRFLHFLLEKCEKTTLSEALLIAIPMVYASNVATKLDRGNIVHIQSSLSYLAPKSKNTEIFDIIIHEINNWKQTIEPSGAYLILLALCRLQCTPNGLPEILLRVQNILATNMTCLNQKDIMHVMNLLIYRIRREDLHYYHEGFIDACASTVISEDWGFGEAIMMLEKLLNIGHVQIPLLDYIAGKCFENPSLLESCPPERIATLINGFATADYKPIFWDSVRDKIMNHSLFQAKTAMNYPLPKLVCCLLALDLYCPKLVEKVFQDSTESYMRLNERRQKLSIYQAVKTLFPQYSGYSPGDDYVDKLHIVQDGKKGYFPLINALECALGGHRYVLTNVTTKLGHNIDHVFVMRRGGFPVAINNTDEEMDEISETALEDLNPLHDSQVILVWYVPTSAYSINTQRLKGIWSMKVKTLETFTGYTVIMIQQTMWMSLSEAEKIPYLMQAIKLKCDETSGSATM